MELDATSGRIFGVERAVGDGLYAGQDETQAGVTAGGALGVQQSAAAGDLESPAAAWRQHDVGDPGVVVFEDALRQTGGFTDVPSRGAVLDDDGQLLFVDFVHGKTLTPNPSPVQSGKGD